MLRPLEKKACLRYSTTMPTATDAKGPGRVSESSREALDRYRALDKADALKDLDSLRTENRVLDRIINDAAMLMARHGIEDMLGFVTGRLLERFIPECMIVAIEPPRRDELRQYGYRNLKPSQDRLSGSDFRRLRAYLERRPYPISAERLVAELGAEGFTPAFHKLGLELFYPLSGIGGLYGVFMLAPKLLGGAYTPLERLYLDRMIRFLAVGVQNVLHHESSITDAKTGLYNHSYFSQRLDDECERIKRHGGSAGVLMIDADHFKLFNDRYGHLAGDEALRALATMIKDAMRNEDTVARFGGEEFSVLALECDPAKLMDIAERIRLGAANLRIQTTKGPKRFTVSVGARVIGQEAGLNPQAALADADRALYLAKAEGRNRSVLFEPGLLFKSRELRAASPSR